MSSEASLAIGGKSLEMSIKDGSIGPSVLDISKLYAQTGMFTYDPGFTSTASCESKITYIDGDEGILLYRGYPIEQLAEHGDFLETCYLLLYGELPTPSQRADFNYNVTHHTMVHEQMMRFFQGFRRDAHPMSVMVASVGALSAFYHDSTDISDPTQRMIASMRMIAKIPTLAAWLINTQSDNPSFIRKIISTIRQISSVCVLLSRVKIIRSILYSHARLIGFSFSMLIMSKMRPPPRCVWQDRREQILSHALPLASLASGGRPMAARMKLHSKCFRKSVRQTGYRTILPEQKTRTTLSG